MIIDCIGCLHGNFPKLEGGDLLIVTGDLTARDEKYEYDKFCDWILDQPYKKKVFIAGNHDNYIQSDLSDYMVSSCKSTYGFKDYHLVYLCDSGIEFDGLKIWGSPWTPWFRGVNPKCKAFMKSEGSLDSKFSLIPDDTDILITHGPPYGILDQVERRDVIGTSHPPSKLYKNTGSFSLANAILRIPKLKLNVFSHIHEGYGKITYKRPGIDDENNTIFVNCSMMNERYQPVNKPIRIVL